MPYIPPLSGIGDMAVPRSLGPSGVTGDGGGFGPASVSRDIAPPPQPDYDHTRGYYPPITSSGRNYDADRDFYALYGESCVILLLL